MNIPKDMSDDDINDIIRTLQARTNERQLLNTGKYKPCKDIDIGSIIEYLQQFPPSWRITIGEGRAQPVLIDTGMETILTSIGSVLEL